MANAMFITRSRFWPPPSSPGLTRVLAVKGCTVHIATLGDDGWHYECAPVPLDCLPPITSLAQIAREGGGQPDYWINLKDLLLYPPRPWREVMGFPLEATVTLDMVEARYRRLATTRHPDAGGSDAAMAELNAARDQAREALKP